MLDLSRRPPAVLSPVASIAASTIPSEVSSFAQFRAYTAARTDLTASTQTSYLGAIDKAASILNRPLTAIDADLAAIAQRFPLKGFDLDHWPTERAYKTFRGRLLAALKSFCGVHAEKARLRAMEDDWTVLLAAIEPRVQGRVGISDWHPMKLQMLKSFALVARSYGWQPRDMTLERAQQIDRDFSGNVRDSHARSLKRLDELRAFSELLPLLPAGPINFLPERRAPAHQEIPQEWEVQFISWIESVTNNSWDPVAKEFTDRHEPHAHVMKSALRTALRAGLDIGMISREEGDLKAILACDETLYGIAGELFRRQHEPKSKGHLEPRSARKYLKALNQLRAHLGLDCSGMRQVLANNKTARAGRTAEKSMTKVNRKFCERLVEKKHLRRRFLTSFLTLREAAEKILAQAKAEGRKLTALEISQVRMLGVCACFAAIEIGGAPLRRRNVMALTCVGEDAQFRIPKKGKKPFKVFLPAAVTKNNAVIEFPIARNKYGAYDTICWYLEVIRPLFAHADTSPFLFPAVRTPGRSLNADFFAAHFSQVMRAVVGLPMTPHQMRHGQTSLLLDRYPNEIEVIAKRIDDTAATLRQFYGWLNALKLVERGQDMMIGLMDD
ncbi:hypothetical protein T8A63_20565 (plasmid) [Sulfitobacter sp. OXR-159]|uniref:hypothetical protein n=1 Tax=Sulfitobacter sp. OXR-159 TaxID=3100174 RepID=UPI002AC8C2C3|nr:hypothetical protein [Sulfitobacter sp. OXR-159]WPZ31720.1 hypothetical protein T8A63_20565 [Sulfitobacter sp. OXR-159]